MHTRTTTVTALLAAVLVTALASPAQAQPPPRVTEATIETHLKGASAAKWKGLPKAKKQATVTVLADPYFGVPAKAKELENRYAGLEVLEQVSAPQAITAALVSRTSWVKQNWTVFGISYTEVQTIMGYTTNGGTVTGVTRCYNTYHNWVPVRSVNGESWYTLGNGLADCWTEWQLSRPFQGTVTGYQGLRVNGYGQILKIWYV